MIYITGDTHGEYDFFKLKMFFREKKVTIDDYLIILGDAAIVWSEKENYISKYSALGLTILFIDGNHENFVMLNEYPVVEYLGGKCHKLADNIYHIIRGEIITINNNSFFCMGGATSIDKAYRTPYLSWWPEENIAEDDIVNGLDNLKKVGFYVDYVLTHCGPSSVVEKMFDFKPDKDTAILEKFDNLLFYSHWFFGHYHFDKTLGKYRCFYDNIYELPLISDVKKAIIEGTKDAEEDRTKPVEEVLNNLHKMFNIPNEDTTNALEELEDMENNPTKYKRYQSFQDIINEMDVMKKILVIGRPGSGKSYFSKRLSPLLVIPLYHLDNIFWKDDGSHISREELLRECDKIFALDSYILDGNYKSTLYYRINYCDTIFFLDIPKDVCMEGLKRRENEYRDDIPSIITKRSIDGLIRAVENFDNDDRLIIESEIKKHPEVNVITFHSRKEVDEYLESLKEKGV